MFAGIVAIYLQGKIVDVDVLGEAQSAAECKMLAGKALDAGRAGIEPEYEIVIKCFDEKQMPKSVADFEAAPIAAAGFGSKK